jgi:predicted RNA-binding protein YlxR (DUF448 family)
VPHRRCVGCGRVAPKSELLRLAAAQSSGKPARAIVDPPARLPGRGAYLCRAADASRPAAACLARASRRGGIARALRRPIAGELIYEHGEGLESVSR